MCRNIKNLRVAEVRPTEADYALAALQYVRKVSGYRAPSKVNKVAFDAAVLEIAESTRKLLSSLIVQPAPSSALRREAHGGHLESHDSNGSVG